MKKLNPPVYRVATMIASLSLIFGLALSRSTPKSTAKTGAAVKSVKKVHVNAKVAGDVGITAEKLEEIAEEQLRTLKLEVVEESEEDDVEIYVGFLNDDDDLDDDGIPNSKDPDDEGDGVDDDNEQITTEEDANPDGASLLLASPQLAFLRASSGASWFSKAFFVISIQKPASHDEEEAQPEEKPKPVVYKSAFTCGEEKCGRLPRAEYSQCLKYRCFPEAWLRGQFGRQIGGGGVGGSLA